MSAPTYIILDFETTGLDPASSEIIEIGALLVVGLEVKDRFHCLVKPYGEVPELITQLTGITPTMLERERTLAEVMPEFLVFLRDLPIVAHNASMERRFLDHHVAPVAGVGGFDVHNSIEPLALVLPDAPSLSLESLRNWAGLGAENAHRADQDCEDLLAVLVRAREWMTLERAQVGQLATELLGESAWFWKWFFTPGPEGIAATAGRGLAAVFSRPERGDLRKLREADSEREIDWSRAVTAKEVHDVLTGGEAHGIGFREPQEQMAQQVRAALAEGGRVAIEAPTGTGKSVAYLVPGVLAAEATGAPLVVSTHSKNLQDQLLEKDIPLVRALLGRPALRATTVKGQENYLCLRKLNERVLSLDSGSTLEERWSIVFVLALASVSSTAELDRVSRYLRNEYPALDELLERVRSHRTTTIGPACPFYKSCHFFDSARLAHESEVIIANHALVFRWPQNLPQIRTLVFDEAHHLEERITEAYSISLEEESITVSLDHLSRKRGARGSRGAGRTGDGAQIARLLDPLTLPPPHNVKNAAEQLETLSESARARLTQLRAVVPLAMSGTGADGYEESADLAAKPLPEISESLRNLAGALGDLRAYLDAGLSACGGHSTKSNPALDLLSTHAFRFASFEQAARAALGEMPEGEGEAAPETSPGNWLRLLHWNARESTWRLSVTPIEVESLSFPFFAGRRSVILTSATLSSGASPTFVTDRIGFKPTQPLVALPSPYDLAAQARIYIPERLAPPGTPQHLDALTDFTFEVARRLGGRTLLLMTSNRRMRHAAEILRERLKPLGITVFDSSSDRRAAEAFRVTERALLIGGERYGEGLDIAGRALSCVILEKINEAMTRGPLAEVRKSRTKFALYDYDFPLRMMWLKQRAGRLIRSPSDTGAVVIFDSRFHAWSEASRQHVKKALAPMPLEGGSCEHILERISTLDGLELNGQ